MTKTYGDHGEIFWAVLFDKFIFPGIKKQGKQFDFLDISLYLDSRYEKKTKSWWTQLSDLRFELTFKDSKNTIYIANMFIEAKTYMLWNSNNSLMESASKLNDKLHHIQDFFLNTIGSSYCAFRPCETALDQDANLRLTTLCENSNFPESRFEIENSVIPISKAWLESLFDEFESIKGTVTPQWKIKSRGSICQDLEITSWIEQIIENKNLNFNNVIFRTVDKIKLQINKFCNSDNRYWEIISHKIKLEWDIQGFPNNTKNGFEYVIWDKQKFDKNFSRAKQDHKQYWIRKEVLIDQPLLYNDINEIEAAIRKSQEDIYEEIEQLLDSGNLIHPIISDIMWKKIGSVTSKIKDHLFSTSNHQKWLFFEWGANFEHKIKFDEKFILEYKK